MSAQDTLPLLPDIMEVEPLGAADEACMAEVRAVLVRHDALQRFGLTLLHRHFEVGDDEMLVERIDVENRMLVTTPVKTAEIGEGIETSWRLDHPQGMQVCETQCQLDRDAQGNPIHMRPHYRTS